VRLVSADVLPHQSDLKTALSRIGRASIRGLNSQGFIVIMMICGAIGFYLGIDTPPLEFDANQPNRKVDSAELFSAVGTFLAAMTALTSVGIIVLRENPRISWTILIMLGWAIGLMMQIIAGVTARTRA
jgi:hypothetical protein